MGVGDGKSKWRKFWSGEMYPDTDPPQDQDGLSEAGIEPSGISGFQSGRCFCGCGEKVSFKAKTMNKQGHRTQQLLDALTALQTRAAKIIEDNPSEDERTIHRLRSISTVCEPICHAGKDYIRECKSCLLYTSDAADDLLCVDLGGRRHIKKKKKNHSQPLTSYNLGTLHINNLC